jgi:L-seryl-tRNA(Ser) seleniumtransferase
MEIGRKADLLALRIRSLGHSGLSVTIQDDLSQTGGGALPTGKLPTKVVAIGHMTISANQLESRLRLGKPAIITRIKEGMVLFDPRTLNDQEIGKIVEAVHKLLQEAAGSR